MVSGFCRGVNEVLALLECHTYWLLVSYRRFRTAYGGLNLKDPVKCPARTLMMGTMGFTETSVTTNLCCVTSQKSEDPWKNVASSPLPSHSTKGITEDIKTNVSLAPLPVKPNRCVFLSDFVAFRLITLIYLNTDHDKKKYLYKVNSFYSRSSDSESYCQCNTVCRC